MNDFIQLFLFDSTFPTESPGGNHKIIEIIADF